MALDLQTRNAQLCACETYPVSGGSEVLAIVAGDLVSPERTTNPTPSGIEQYMLIRVYGTMANTHATEVARITPYGASNLIKSLEYTDTSGYTRHTGISGRALELMAYARQYDVVGGSMDIASDYGVSLGAGGSDIMPSTIAAVNGTATFSHTFVLPFAYSPFDQRGAVPASLAMGQQTLKLTFPTKGEAFVPTAGNGMKAIYKGGTVAYTSLAYEVVTFTKNRNLPAELPVELFAYSYQISESARSNITAGTDNKFPLEPARDHFNVFQVYDNGGVLNYESDVNTLSQLFGGSQDARRLSPQLHNALAKNTLKAGIPPGTYYSNHRESPLNVAAKGGTIDIVFNPKTVQNGAVVYTIVDYMQQGNMLGL